MNSLSIWQAALITSWSQVISAFLFIIPAVLGAVIVFVVGLILAYWVKKLVIEGLRNIKLESYLKNYGVDKYLAKADIHLTLSELVGTILQWFIILIFFIATVNILGLTVVSDVLSKVLGYIPNVLAASLILGAGYVIAGLVDTIVRGALVSVDHQIAKPIGKLARYVIILVSFFAAVDELQIAQGLVTTFFQGLTYTVVLVIGLSVGLGAKDLVSKLLMDWYERLKK